MHVTQLVYSMYGPGHGFLRIWTANTAPKLKQFLNPKDGLRNFVAFAIRQTAENDKAARYMQLEI